MDCTWVYVTTVDVPRGCAWVRYVVYVYVYVCAREGRVRVGVRIVATRMQASPVQDLTPQPPTSLDAYIRHRPAAGSCIADPPQVDVFGIRRPLVPLAGCSRNLTEEECVKWVGRGGRRRVRAHCYSTCY